MENKPSFTQIEAVRSALLGRKAMEKFAEHCQTHRIASRATVYKAMNLKIHNSKLRLHRDVLAEAIEFIKQDFTDGIIPKGEAA